MLLPMLNTKGDFCLLDAQNIVYLQTNGAGELAIYSYDEKYRVLSKVKDWTLLLQDAGFIRIDRGTVVNTRSIEAFDADLNVIKLRTSNGGLWVPVSRKMNQEVANHFPQK
ncbi:LytTR family DNA-binding domain-containing protein [Cohnella abietis]|uniref:HTH LytTR-type domain-containing protein n=1 Tax=Cohnella abietis TaxID=2507935 RepID=A0A3T1D016_9BACL|nr:LytTR family DNA-binding domain-containing protein [Cohnella abietis]BBI31355.1 hypothetical protein KCTCHS21_07540 [Cohnella abietis]